MRRKALERGRLLQRLELIELGRERLDEESYLEHMSLGATPLTLAEIDHEREYELARDAAKHLLGHVHEPAYLEPE